jgi:murein DD-endopeptidase MepM/ murein hydrolase activator NlpD
MKNLKVGDRVSVGQPVGRVGNTGVCSRGAHLHMTFAKKSDPRYAKTFDPVKFIDQKIKKQNKKPKLELSPLQKLAKNKVNIGTIWTWAKRR